MFKRSKGKFGGNLGKTTGWIHRSTLKKKKVQFIGEVSIQKLMMKVCIILKMKKQKF